MSTQPLPFPIERATDPIVAPEFYAREHDDIQPIATAYSHSKLMADIIEAALNENWADMLRNEHGQELLLREFETIDLTYDRKMDEAMTRVMRVKFEGEIVCLSDTLTPKVLEEIQEVLAKTEDRLAEEQQIDQAFYSLFQLREKRV